MRLLRVQYILPLTMSSLCLVALCIFTAISLFHQQATITGVLRENVSSRRAASDLRGSLITLIALETHQIESVADLHARAEAQIEEIRSFANHTMEKDVANRLRAGFTRYLRMWQELPPRDADDHERRIADATRFLETNVLYPCREIEAYNDQQVEATTSQHEHVLNQLAWGMAVVGGLGAIAGVVFGFGVARILSASIQRLQVQIRDVAGRLGPNSPEIVLTGDVGFSGLHEELDALAERIEAVLEKLHQRDREVARAEQLAAAGRLAAGVGHELRNPLTSIKMLVQTGLEDGANLTREDLAIIEEEIRRMERSLQTFLETARPPKLERRMIEITGILEAVLGLVRGRAEKQGVTLRLESGGVRDLIDADAAQLQQVVVNLVLNGLDAMPTGGVLSLRTREANGWLELEVADTGRGIPNDMIPKLYEPFVSSKETGMGLGLVISRRIVEDHGGVIENANPPTGGALFVVRLPVACPAPAGAAP